MRQVPLALSLLLAAAAAFGGEHHPGANECSSSRIRLGDGMTYTREETIEAGQLASLRAVSENAPVSLSGGKAAGYTVVVCKAATREEDLDAIRVTLDGGELRAHGPAGHRWLAAFDIRAPQGAQVSIEAENGPISVRDFDGALVLRAKNGPLSLNGVGGSVDASTVNGPVSVSGGSGSVKLRASNGPVTVRLDGTGWAGAGLEAQTTNGPLSVKVPRGYGSGVRVDSRGGGPVACKAAGCERYEAEEGFPFSREPRTIELGSGPAVVRLSTDNGPVSIKDAD